MNRLRRTVAFLQILDDNIKKMETSLAKNSTPTVKAAKLVANARKNRNAEVPINQLPIEVITEIFKHAVLPTRPVPSSDEPHLQKLGMISNVCARWYNIVRNTAALWAVVDTMIVWDEALELLLERSKKSPLFITCGSGYHQNESDTFKVLWPPSSSIMKIVSEISRWRSVDIGLTSSGSNLLRALESPAPILEEFNFYLETPRHASKITNLFKGEAPKLEQLRVSGLSFAWSTGLFQNLTHLEIASIRHNGPTLSEVLTAIQSSSKLQIIRLHDLAFSSDSAIPSNPPAVFKSLEFISITSLPCFETQAILSSIDAPELRSLTALPCVRGGEMITSSFVNASFYRFQTLVQTALSHARHMRITFIRHAIEIRTYARHPASDFYLRIPHRSDADSFEACLPNFIFDPQEHNVRILLRVQAIPHFSKIELIRIFERFRWVTNIEMIPYTVVPSTVVTGLEALIEFMISGWVEEEIRRWPFPRLVSFQPQRWMAPNQLVRMIREREGVDVPADVEPESYQAVFKVLPARISRLEVRQLFLPLDRSQYEEITSIVGHSAIV
ncbi:hypothetical protein FRC05_008730 [Tulasnella sp. 425]|nr:hypothetical protein FRC05_008730 [Tulasnella sp. 425]